MTIRFCATYKSVRVQLFKKTKCLVILHINSSFRFLTSSVNTYNWRSCHALDGEYRAGNLSYMADNVTFMCYIKGEAKLQYPFLPHGISWNSKKWRMLVHMDPTDQICF